MYLLPELLPGEICLLFRCIHIKNILKVSWDYLWWRNLVQKTVSL